LDRNSEHNNHKPPFVTRREAQESPGLDDVIFVQGSWILSTAH